MRAGNERATIKMSWQPSKWVRLKTDSTVFRQKQTHVELMSEAVRQFCFSQERNGFDKTSCAVQNTSWYLLHSIFSKRKSFNISSVNLFENFLPFDRKRHLKATNNCTRRFTRHNVFDANWHTLVKRCGCFFHQQENGFTKTFSADENTTSYLPHSISSRQSVSVATVNRIKDAYSIWS